MIILEHIYSGRVIERVPGGKRDINFVHAQPLPPGVVARDAGYNPYNTADDLFSRWAGTVSAYLPDPYARNFYR